MKTVNYMNEELTLHLANYKSDPMALALSADTKDGYPYFTVTVNFGSRDSMGNLMKKGCSYVDDNNIPDVLAFLASNGLGTPTGDFKQSGFCTYPLVEFDMDKLAECVPQSEIDNYNKFYDEAYGKLQQRDRKIKFDDFDLGLDDEASAEGIYGPREMYLDGELF